MVYYISDIHFGHENIIRYFSRPFSSAEEMDAVIADNWNKRVVNDDVVYVLGDIAADGTYLKKFEKLKGIKHLIIGNHDQPILNEIIKSGLFASVSYSKVIDTGDKTITLCHFPMYSFIGDYLIYGHVHNNFADESYIQMRRLPNALNACVEINGYSPVTFDELVKNNNAVKKQYDKNIIIQR